jgi:nicotinamidase-related amidase
VFILISQGSHDWQLIRELQPLADPSTDILVDDKTRYDAFLYTTLDEKLKALGVGRVFVVGCMTNLCCETTARSAFNRDYDVYFVNDANATSSAKMHAASVLNLEFGFAKIVTVKEAMAMVHV